MKLPQFLMFIPFLKKLMVETSAGSIHDACERLEENGIQYRMQTLRLRGAVGTGLESRAYMSFNVSQRSWGSQPSTSYVLYVRHKDYEAAKKLIESIELE